jgi:hypothetical protein
LVIYLSILALSENSNLWNKYQVKDTQYLLFTETDFEDFANSEIYNDLQKLSNSINVMPTEAYFIASCITAFNSFPLSIKIE